MNIPKKFILKSRHANAKALVFLWCALRRPGIYGNCCDVGAAGWHLRCKIICLSHCNDNIYILGAGVVIKYHLEWVKRRKEQPYTAYPVIMTDEIRKHTRDHRQLEVLTLQS